MGTILYMNDKARTTFARHGDMVGKNLFDCHGERSREIIRRLLTDGGTNVYTIEKNGVRKMIYQTAWRVDGVVGGLAEISMEIPAEMPHHIRKEKHQGCRGSPEPDYDSRTTIFGLRLPDYAPRYHEFGVQLPSHTRFPGFRVCVPGNSGYIRSRPAQFRPGKSYRRTKFLEGLKDPLIFMPQKFCRVYLLKCKIHFTFILSQTFKQPRYDKGITTSPQF